MFHTLQAPASISPTRDELIAETEALWVVGAFGEAESLCNKYANPAFDDLSDEDLRATLHQAATEWESELDEFFVAED